MKNHRHTTKTEMTVGYSHCLMRSEHGHIVTHCEPRSHGGICIVSTCACGAVRRENRNGRFSEKSEWMTAAGAPARS